MLETVEETPVEAIESEIAKFQHLVDLGNSLETLTKSDAWNKIFTELFLKAYRETSAYNVGILTPDGRDNYLHQITARSIFERFVDGIKDDAFKAQGMINELEPELVDEKRLAETGIEEN